MIVKVKKLNENAVIPKYAKDGDAGLDLTAVGISHDDFGNVVYRTGLAFEIPEGYVGLVFPRSSIFRYGLSLCNCVGVIDSGYRGEILCKFRQSGHILYSIGDRVAQIVIMPYPKIQLVEADTLTDTERGEGGFGSTE